MGAQIATVLITYNAWIPLQLDHFLDLKFREHDHTTSFIIYKLCSRNQVHKCAFHFAKCPCTTWMSTIVLLYSGGAAIRPTSLITLGNGLLMECCTQDLIFS